MVKLRQDGKKAKRERNLAFPKSRFAPGGPEPWSTSAPGLRQPLLHSHPCTRQWGGRGSHRPAIGSQVS